MLYVLFTKEGIPEWIGPEPIAGSEPIEGYDLDFLVSNMRLPDGTWQPKPPPAPPTAEELLELERIQAETQAQAEKSWQEWVEQEVARRSNPDVLLRAMGTITIAELKNRVAAIRLQVETGL